MPDTHEDVSIAGQASFEGREVARAVETLYSPLWLRYVSNFLCLGVERCTYEKISNMVGEERRKKKRVEVEISERDGERTKLVT
jgi:hypothetical protein